MVTLTWSEDTGAVVRDTAALTSRPFGGNFVLTEDHHRRLDQALEAGLRIVSFIWGDPSEYVGAIHDAGGLVLLTVGSAEEARRAVASGVDVLVAQGWEAGGHVWSGVATLPLVPAVVDAVAPVPVIAAGGIGDARGIAAALILGAAAVQIGTAYLHCPESPIAPAHREGLAGEAAEHSRFTNLYSGGLARGLPSRLMVELGAIRPEAPPFPLANVAPLGFRPMWAGQAARLGKAEPARALTERLGREALALLGGRG
jgi:nitronate monooxygenase